MDFGNKLLDDFGCGEIQPVQVHLPTRSEPSSSSTTWSIKIIQASSSAAYQKVSDRLISNEYAASCDYHLVLDQRCSDSSITSTPTKLTSDTQYRQVFYPEIPYHKRHLALKPVLMSLYAVLTRPPRNLRELRLGTPRADKTLSDPSETKDHVRSGRVRVLTVKGLRALSFENDSPTIRLGARESAPCLYGSTPKSTKASTTNVDKAPSQTLRLLDHSRTGSSTVSDSVGRELEEEGYPVVDYESDLQTAMSTTVR
uniref:Ulp1 protease-like n=1 Tax=Oryza sativa subsp. japonica TaxID=39947 RepID=Q69TB5_ORYSJ|nr:ulp1 protease-like [Oryza sativa Japonica Group]